MNEQTDQEDKEAKFQELFERARKGVLTLLNDKGGSLPMDEMHEYSLNTYFIQHQRFSQMMEAFVSEELIDYDATTQISIITDKGREFIK